MEYLINIVQKRPKTTRSDFLQLPDRLLNVTVIRSKKTTDVAKKIGAQISQFNATYRTSLELLPRRNKRYNQQ